MADDARVGARARAAAARASRPGRAAARSCCRSTTAASPGRARPRRCVLDPTLAGRRTARRIAPSEALRLAPRIGRDGLLGDRLPRWRPDDARLVLRVSARPWRTARASSTTLGSTPARDGGGVIGARIEDRSAASRGEVRHAWSSMPPAPGPTRGAGRADAAAAARQPSGVPARGVCRSRSGELAPSARPPAGVRDAWEGAALVGTTDLDHGADEPADDHGGRGRRTCSKRCACLSAAAPRRGRRYRQLRRRSPDRRRRARRSVGRAATRRSREHGLVTVTGGKLTTFRVIAVDALREVGTPGHARVAPRAGAGVAASRPAATRLAPARRRLRGRYGAAPSRPTERPAARWRADSCGPSCTGRCATSRCAISTTCCCAAPASAWLRRGAESLLPQLEAPVLRRARLVERRLERRMRALLGTRRRGTRCGDVTTARPTICCWRSTAARKAFARSLFDPNGDLAARRRSRSSGFVAAQPGWLEHDGEAFWNGPRKPASNSVAQPSASRGAVRRRWPDDAARHPRPLDADGRRSRPAIVWLDQRRATACRRSAGSGPRLPGLAGAGDDAPLPARGRGQLVGGERARSSGPRAALRAALRLADSPWSAFVDSVAARSATCRSTSSASVGLRRRLEMAGARAAARAAARARAAGTSSANSAPKRPRRPASRAACR